ncbi:MAG TPA: asparagine synthase (glutamine-hydrolyzing) [Phycisphaerales bacterium]|nr:asparagine synthase (glutamine-hydrolyzing) [Phycisphaerales bacterium]
MCGIAGHLKAAPRSQADAETVRRMNRAQVHRGPDGEGEFADSHVHIAMRRLSIIDLEGGWQPLYNEDRTIALVANGEVYNHIELRAELEARGHRFATHSDCETIAHLYEEFGVDCLHKLRGMYAFALYDIPNKRVLIGRDRMGEKPLYLVERPGEIWFCSELRALLSGGVIPFELDAGAVNLFFHYNYVPEPHTAVKGVRKLPAGCYLSVDLADWKVTQHRYWRLSDAPPIEGDPPKIIREELERIGDLIIRADVPVGVALSGGVDSTLVAALAAKRRPGLIHALSVGYPGRPIQDERHIAAATAKRLNMPFHDVEVDPREVVELFPERALWRDDPIADPAGHGYYAVSRLARNNGIPVLIQGQGADELFWGYGWVRSALEASVAKQEGTPAARARDPFRKMFPDGHSPRAIKSAMVRTAQRWLGWAQGHPDENAPADQLIFYNGNASYQRARWLVRRVFPPKFAAEAFATDPASIFRRPRPWNDLPVMFTELMCETYLLENGIVQGDRLSMINSVELRLPLCDYRLAEIAVGLRKVQSDHRLPFKHWLKTACRDLVPDEVLYRPKTGFTPPHQSWMNDLINAYRLSLESGYLVEHGVLAPEAAAEMTNHRFRLPIWSEAIYKTLVLEFWCRGMASAAAQHSPMTFTHRIPHSTSSDHQRAAQNGQQNRTQRPPAATPHTPPPAQSAAQSTTPPTLPPQIDLTAPAH